MRELIKNLADRVISSISLEYPDAKELIRVSETDLHILLREANRIRQHFRGQNVHICAITNAKSGACSQDCRFCAQSIFYKTKTEVYPLIEPPQMLERARDSYNNGSRRFCLVTSGDRLTDEEIYTICQGLRLIKKEFAALKLDASLGLIAKDAALRLKEAGLSRYNHNLETSKDYFPQICTTQAYQERLDTAKIIKALGLELCCGGIFGLGETEVDCLKLGFSLRELDVDCIPLNFLAPIPGTPLENQKKLSVDTCLKLIAIFRFIHPEKEIKVCGGRESVLKNRQSEIFFAGADSIILGDYLTTKGNKPVDDFKILKKLGLKYEYR